MCFLKKWVVAGVFIIASMAGIADSANAQFFPPVPTVDPGMGDDATLNHCWGQLASHLGKNGIMGLHSSAHGAFTPNPGDGGRKGVGNVSKEEHGDLSAGGQGIHAISVGSLLGASFTAGLPEGSIDPIDCTASGNSNNGSGFVPD